MKNIRTILIANRGEIASRVIRTCKVMGIKTVSVFSDADRNAPFVSEADVAIHIGASQPSLSYLDQNKIISAAKRSNADAIHPGYGFLSENSSFARRCASEDIIFIGPNPEAIDAMGSKSNAKAMMQLHGVPTVPGYQGNDQSIANLIAQAQKIGFPLLLKATAGGGGKGMRIVEAAEELSEAIGAAKRESKSAFDDDELIIEKYIQSGRHIEFQIFGDQHGNAIHLLERECSIQRRYQKVVEESPSPVMTAELREQMGEAAVNAAKALKYDNAGTVEFIYDDESGQFYFLEVNTRLQVEHPVTEAITGLDLVKMQIESAQGLSLKITQADVRRNGYALEMRLYAENPRNDFMPQTGMIYQFEWPQVDGLRIETAIRSGSEISIFYDPMIAKLIVHDRDRSSAIQKMNYVLKNLACLGVNTNQDFLQYLTEQVAIQNGDYNTHYIQDHIDLNEFGSKDSSMLFQAGLAATLFAWKKRDQKRSLLKSLPSGWRNSFYQHQQDNYQYDDQEISIQYRYCDSYFEILSGEEKHQVNLIEMTSDAIRIEIDGMQTGFRLAQNGNDFYLHCEATGNIHLTRKDRLPIPEKEEVQGGYIAPMPSQIISILVQEGQEVKTGDSLMIISSMKMENTISAIADGKVESVLTAEGANVEAGHLLIQISDI